MSYGHPRSLHLEDHPLEAYILFVDQNPGGTDRYFFIRDKYSLAVTVVRPFNLYGPAQSEAFLIPMLIRQASIQRSRAYEVATTAHAAIIYMSTT